MIYWTIYLSREWMGLVEAGWVTMYTEAIGRLKFAKMIYVGRGQ